MGINKIDYQFYFPKVGQSKTRWHKCKGERFTMRGERLEGDLRIKLFEVVRVRNVLPGEVAKARKIPMFKDF